MSLVFLTVFIMITVTGSTARAQEGDVIVIANQSVVESTLDKRTLANLFLKKKKTWANRDSAEIVILEGGEVHKTFLKLYLGKTEQQYASHWNKLVFTGTGRPPKSFDNERQVVAYVASVKGAIGYVGPGVDISGVKRIAIEN
jgi:ABC-type phosphate transport system substrate-binding protein